MLSEESKEEMSSLPPLPKLIPLPKFSRDDILAFNGVSTRCLLHAKKLLRPERKCRKKPIFILRRRILNQRKRLLILRKPSLGKKKRKKKFEIINKLSKIYLRHVKKKAQKKRNFMKCDYLKDLVRERNLNYFVLELFPFKRCYLYMMKMVKMTKPIRRQRVLEEYCGTFLESDLLSIDDEEIPLNIWKFILRNRTQRDLMYNYHIIIQIKKFLSEDITSQPVFSSFVLLKTSNKLIINLNKKFLGDKNYNDVLPDRKKESKLFFKVSRPLHLGIKPILAEIPFYLYIYQNPFGIDSIKFTQLKAKYGTRPMIGFNCIQVLPFYRRVKMKKEFIKFVSKRRIPDPLKIHGTLVESETFWLKQFEFFLTKRSLDIPRRYNIGKEFLVEVFLIMYPNTLPGMDGRKREAYISVFYKNRMFYCCLTQTSYSYDPYDHKFLQMVGERRNVDRFIIKILEILSHRFNKQIRINYTNFIQMTEIHFCSDDPNYYLNDLGSSKIKPNWITYHNPFGTTFMSNIQYDPAYDSFQTQHHLVGGRFKVVCRSFLGSNYSYIIPSHRLLKSARNSNEKPLCNFKENYFFKDFFKDSTQRLLFYLSLCFVFRFGKQPCGVRDDNETHIQAAYLIESDTVKATFEPHKFEKTKLFSVESYLESRTKGKRIEFYPSLTSQYITKEYQAEDENEVIPDDNVFKFLSETLNKM